MQRKRILSLVLSMLICIAMMPMAVFATGGGTEPLEITGNEQEGNVQAEPTTVVKIDVGGENIDDANYKIDDTRIILRKKDAVYYELTGTTDKKISVWGSNNAKDINQAFYIRLNNVTVNGGIVVENSPVKMVVDVPAGTANTIESISANDLTIKGEGTINASDLRVTQKTSYMPSALKITDTTIKVQCPVKRSCEWNGPCVLSGNANVTYTSFGDYAPLQVGVKSGDSTHSLTLEDNAKLYCLQDDAETPSDYSVSGLELFGSTTTLLLKDNSYLEAEGKASSGKYVGCAIVSENEIKVTGNATIKATAYGAALSTLGDVIADGGKIIADSKNSNGIYADGNINVSNNAEIEAKGYWPALFGNNSVTINGSTVKAEATNDVAIFSRGNVEVKASVINAKGAEGYSGIKANNTASVSGSWVETSGDETFENAITDSVLFNGKTGKTIGNLSVNGNVTMADDMTLTIPKETSITVPAGKTFTNHGTIQVDGTFTNNGTTICTRHTGGKATSTAKAKCVICGEEYGELAPSSGGYYHPVQKPEIATGAGGNSSLESNGTTLVITPDEGMQIAKVTVNGKEVTPVDNKITGLKTGDKVEVSFTKILPTKETVDKTLKEKAEKLTLTVRTTKTAKKNINVFVKKNAAMTDFLQEVQEAGYTVKYKFYRSEKKSSGYTQRLIKMENRYLNTIGKKGTKYYYKAKLQVYDTDGNLIVSTGLQSCKYGMRSWNK